MSEYADDARIDKYNLDVEWEGQPALYLKYAGKLAQAILERDNCKVALDVKKASLDKVYRVSLEKELGKKPTEGAISAAIDLDVEYQELQKKLNDHNYEVNVLTAAKFSLDQRKKALEYLTQLFLASYYSKPVIPKDSQYRMSERRRDERNAALSTAVTEHVEERRRRRKIKD